MSMLSLIIWLKINSAKKPKVSYPGHLVQLPTDLVNVSTGQSRRVVSKRGDHNIIMVLHWLKLFIKISSEMFSKMALAALNWSQGT